MKDYYIPWRKIPNPTYIATRHLGEAARDAGMAMVIAYTYAPDTMINYIYQNKLTLLAFYLNHLEKFQRMFDGAIYALPELFRIGHQNEVEKEKTETPAMPEKLKQAKDAWNIIDSV